MLFFKDTANWTDIGLKSQNVGANTKKLPTYDCAGYRYMTKGEWMIAELLIANRIAFTPDVGVVISIPEAERVGKEKATKMYVPDFVFNKRAYLWYEHGNSIELIHGIEAKGHGTQEGRFPKRALKYVRLLREQLGINIKLLSEPQIQRFFDRGRLPIKAFKPQK